MARWRIIEVVMLPVFSLFLAELRRDVRAWYAYRVQAFSSLALWPAAMAPSASSLP
jgi:hypothetical protein